VDVVDYYHLNYLHAISKLHQDTLIFFDQVLVVVRMYQEPFF
jgi:hypothetical protein